MMMQIKHQLNTTTKLLNQNKMKQTAVEWLAKEIWKRGPIGEDTPTWLKELYEQAKQMEKEQIKDAWDNGCEYDGIIDSAEQYYNETFGGN